MSLYRNKQTLLARRSQQVPSLRLYAAVLALFTLTLAACSTGPYVRSDFDRNADFRSYQTFGFVEEPGTDRSGYSSLITRHFKDAIAKEMEALGYQYSATDPDLLVNFFSNVETRSETRTSPVALSASYGYYGYRTGMYLGLPLYDRETRHYKVGTVNVDVVDAEQKQLIWEGVAEGKLTRSDMEEPRQAIHEAVAAIFEKFPTRTQK